MRCEARTGRDWYKGDRSAHRCKRNATGRHNARDLCEQHRKRSERIFAEAEQRWQDAGCPEGDL